MLEIAIVGAGPFGLSIGAHFRRRGIPCRIFGRSMDSWLNHMPAGMMLKSDGFASNIYDPDGEVTLKNFCAEHKTDYSDSGIPVRLETFSAYGLAFQARLLPELENKLVVGLERLPDGFLLNLDSGETVKTRRVVLAVGITHFEHVPENLSHLPAELLSHSFHHADPNVFKGRKVVVIGGGSSAIDLAALLHEADVDVQLVARQAALKFHSKPTGKPRSRWNQIRHPQSGLGPGLRSRFFSDAPMLFHTLPARIRLEAVKKALGPSAGWFVKDKTTHVPCFLGHTVQSAQISDGMVRLHLSSADGNDTDIQADHVIAATGYKVNLSRLAFLNPELRSQIKDVGGAPVLSSSFESSVQGLYFAGLTAANSFGPVMRFAFGAGFAARRLTETMVREMAHNRSSLPIRSVATTAK